MTLEQQLFLTQKALYAYEYPAFADQVIPPAEWAKEIEKILCILPACQAELLSRLNYGIGEKLTGAYAYLSPVLLYIEHELTDVFEIAILSDEACTDIMMSFMELVKSIFERFTIYMLNKMAKTILPQPIENLSEYYEAFNEDMLAAGLERSFLEFPCLARFLIETLSYRMAYVRELITNFVKDKPGDGIITGLEMSKGDVHNFGRTVVIAEYDHKDKIVYKPQSGDVFIAYNRFLDHLMHDHILCDMKYAKVIATYQDHCYIEFIVHQAVSSGTQGMERYYYRVGQLACLCYVLGSEDMHYDNIIACGEYPVVVDLETLLTAKANTFTNTDESSASDRNGLPEIVTRSMVLTVGGVLGGAALSSGDGRNVPYYENGAHIDYHAAGQSIINGFNDAYNKIQANRREITELLHVFCNCRFRSIIRATKTYCDMAGHLQYVKYLDSGMTRSHEVERLFAGYRKCEDAERLKQLYPVFAEECRAVLRGDVPLFWVKADGLCISSDEEELDAHFFKSSPLGHARELLGKMGAEDRDIQNKVMRMIVRSSERRESADFIKPLERTTILTDQEFVKEAEKIFDRIKARQVIWGKDRLFLNVHTEASGNQKGRSNICMADDGLYSGTLGIALFCGALYAITHKREYKECAVWTIENAYEKFVYIPNRSKIGIAEGVGGFAIVLYELAGYLNRPEYKEMARNLLGLPTDLSEIDTFDYLGGLSGYITAAHRVNADGRLVEQAADRLVHIKVPYQNFNVWKSSSSRKPLTGMGHGMSGAALALAKAYEMLHKEEYLLSALDALKYENSLYDEEGGWPDLRDGHSGYMSGVCSGAPGVGLARLAMIGSSKELDEYAFADIDRAVRHCKRSFPMTKDDVCCGNASGIDFLITVGRKANDRQFLYDARQRMSWVIERKNAAGIYGYDTYANLELLGFFDGICGMGYEMLRLVSDEVKGIF